MMISPESYYEYELKGKTRKEVLSKIRGLKNEIGHLANTQYSIGESLFMMSPSTGVQLSCNRHYLERAKQALFEEHGEEYVPSQKEIRYKKFIDDMVYASSVTLYRGGYFGGIECVVTLGEKPSKVIKKGYEGIVKECEFDSKDAAILIDCLLREDIGSWKSYYCCKDVKDGEQWSLEIEYNNGNKKKKFYGSNCYPYNFREVSALFFGWTDV